MAFERIEDVWKILNCSLHDDELSTISYSFHAANSYLKIVIQGWPSEPYEEVFAEFEMMAFDTTEQVNLYCINAKSVSAVMEECNSV